MTNTVINTKRVKFCGKVAEVFQISRLLPLKSNIPLALQAGGSRFDPDQLHHKNQANNLKSLRKASIQSLRLTTTKSVYFRPKTSSILRKFCGNLDPLTAPRRPPWHASM